MEGEQVDGFSQNAGQQLVQLTDGHKSCDKRGIQSKTTRVVTESGAEVGTTIGTHIESRASSRVVAT